MAERVRAIGPRLAALWQRADADGRPPHRVADRMVEERLRRSARSGTMKLRSPGGTIDVRRAGQRARGAAAARVPARAGACGTSRRGAARAHQVVRFDARGFGGSPPGDGLLTMERIADDAAALLDHLGIGQAVVCGVSMGGYAAFAMVRRHADRLRGLVLADTKAPRGHGRGAARPGPRSRRRS